MSVNTDSKTWPMLLDMTKDECKRTLRSLELSAYSNIVSVFRAQGELTKEKRKLLNDLQSVFAISVERHRAEIRRAVNDERLNTIAETLAGPNTSVEWTIEGRRLIPLMPRAPPQVAYTALATRMAQLYCGINSQLPNPCDTAMYGKLDDLGADMEATDSEDETDGLRYITDSMIPQQYNADQGPYTTLPISEARLAKEKLKEKKENIEELNHEVPPSSPLHPSSVSSGSTASPCSQTKPHVIVGSEKRKRKRSLSTDHPAPHSPPPPPVPISQTPSSSNGIQSGQAQSTPASIRQLPNVGPTLGGSSMKITVTGGMTRSSSATSTNSSAQQKVILVSTSAASGTVGNIGNIYQRSISVPILKSAPQSSLSGIPPILGMQSSSSQSAVLKSTVCTPSASAVGSSVMNKIRPRFSSSILSQGSSSLPGLPPRPPLRSRSNSLILQNEGESSGLTRCSSGPSFSQISAGGISSDSVGPNSSCLNFIGATSLQLRPGPSLTPKGNLQVKQEGGKLITHTVVTGTNVAGGSSISSSTLSAGAGSGSGNVGSRIIGRASIPPSSSQGLYMVSTTSGTITVVTRTVASASIATPRVVTVNTINSSRPSIVRGPSSSTVMSVGMNPKAVSTMRQTGSIRPVISGSKSNVIVVHKGTIGSGARPVGLHGLRDLSAKIIKPSQQGLPGNISSNSGILSGTLVVKPSLSSKTMSSTKEPSSVIGTSVSSSSVTTTTVSSSGNNLIVVDLNCENASSAQSSTSTISNILPTPGPSSGISRNVNSLFACTNRSLSEATSSLSKRETSSSHDISTVSASSSLPSTFRVIKSPSLPSDTEDTGFDLVESDLSQRGEYRMPISNLVTSSSDIKDSLDTPDGGNARIETKEIAASSLSVEDHEDEDEEEEDEDNEWLKLGLEDEEPEMEDDDDERGSEVDCEVDKVVALAEESLENEADMVVDSPKAIDSASEVIEGGKLSKAGTSGDASVSSSTGTGNEKEGELQLLVEKAVEVLKDGDSDQARSLLYKAGFELIDSSSDPDQGPSDGFSISNIAGVSSSSAMQRGSGTPLSSSTPLRDESSLGSMSELDPATGYFYSPSAGENSSEPTSNKADSPTPKDDDNPEPEDEN